MKLIKNVKVYTPSYIGKKDVLFDEKIIAINDHIDPSPHLDVIDGSNKMMIPGLIDNHIHITGGGGEAGYQSKVPPLTLEMFVKGGITTAIGLLGTDGFTRSMKELITKAKALKGEGLSVYALSGSYQVPLKTLFDSLEDDMLLIEEIIGAGEIAISDHRSASPTLVELKKILSSVHVGGLLSSKGGVMNVHVGSGKEKIDLLKRLASETEYPVQKIIPTHMNRNEALVKEGFDYIQTYGGVIDLTAYFDENNPLNAHRVFKQAIDEGIDFNRITISSDGGGSLPKFDEEKNFIKMGVGSVEALINTLKQGVNECQIPLETMLLPISKNVAKFYHLKHKGEIKKRFDADLILLDQALNITDVFMKGNVMLKAKQVIQKGMFE